MARELTKGIQEAIKLLNESRKKQCGEWVYEPANSLPLEYDPKTFRRISPDITAMRSQEGIWYDAKGFRDEMRSPTLELSFVIYNVGNIMSERLDIFNKKNNF